MSTLVLYCYKRCFNTKLIQIINNFTKQNLEFVYLEELSETNVNRILKMSQTGTFPLLKVDDFFLSGCVAIMKYLLGSNENISSVLVGKDLKRKSSNSMWLDFTSYNIWPFYEEIIGQITGNMETNNDLFSTAIGDLMQILLRLNKTLTLKTFLIDHQISFADIVMASSLNPYFTLVFDEAIRENFPHVLRWYLFVANLKEVTRVIGKPRLCFISQKPSYVNKVISVSKENNISTKPNQTVDKKNKQIEKKPDKQIEKKPDKQTEKKTVTEKKHVENTEIENDEEESQSKKKKNPLDELPYTPFILDNFKKEYLNTLAKKEVLERLWNIFDPTGWSLWFLHYNKSGDQGKIKFKTCNLKSNFLQKLDQFRKYSFSVHGVYGSEPNLEVEGVWMWRGNDIPCELKEHDSFDFISFKKLDHQNEADRKFIEEFWLNLEPNQIVNGRPVVDAEYFK